MWTLRLPHGSVAVFAAAAIFFDLWAQRWSTVQHELGAATVCWVTLPHLFTLSRRFETFDILSQKQSGAERASSGSLWAVALSLAIFHALQGQTGLIAAFVS